MSVEPGEFFVIHRSRRFSDEHMEKLLKKSGCKTIFSRKGNGMSLLLTEKQAKHQSKIVKYTSAALVAALLVTGGFYGRGAYDAKIQKDKDKQATMIQYGDKKILGEYSDISLEQGDVFDNIVDDFYRYLETMYDLS